MSERVGRHLERQGLLVRDAEESYRALEPEGEDPLANRRFREAGMAESGRDRLFRGAPQIPPRVTCGGVPRLGSPVYGTLHAPIWETTGMDRLTAVEIDDDPTIRRCIAFARAWGYGSLAVGSLFAYRAHEPAVLRSVPDPVGPGNDLGLTGRGEPHHPLYVPGQMLPVYWT